MTSKQGYLRSIGSGVKIRCPHCESPTLVRSSETISRVTRQAKILCTNPDCGWSGVYMVEAIRTISPSVIPHPDVKLSGQKLSASL